MYPSRYNLGATPSALGIGESAISTVTSVGSAVAQGGLNPLSDIQAVGSLISTIAGLLGNPHPAGHDVFIGFPANGGMPFNDNESCSECDSTTLSLQADLIEIMTTLMQNWKAQGAVFSNPAFVVEIRDDGSPAQLHTNVVPMSQALRVQYNIPNGLVGGPGWNDRDPSQYVSLGPPSNVQGMVQTLFNWFKNNGYITVQAKPAPAPSAVALQPVGPSPNLPTTALASSGTVVTVPALFSESVAGIPVWLIVAAGVVFALR